MRCWMVRNPKGAFELGLSRSQYFFFLSFQYVIIIIIIVTIITIIYFQRFRIPFSAKILTESAIINSLSAVHTYMFFIHSKEESSKATSAHRNLHCTCAYIAITGYHYFLRIKSIKINI